MNIANAHEHPIYLLPPFSLFKRLIKPKDGVLAIMRRVEIQIALAVKRNTLNVQRVGEMNLEGTVKKIEVDGYERRLMVQSECRVFFCNYIEFDEYLDPTEVSRVLRLNDRFECRLILKFGLQWALVEPGTKLDIVQMGGGSPSAVVIGRVIEKLDEYSYLAETVGNMHISIEFEDVTLLNIGDTVRAKGELTAEKAEGNTDSGTTILDSIVRRGGRA